MSARRRARRAPAAALLALAALVPAAAGDEAVNPVGVPTEAGVERFLIAAPGAARSAASRVNEDLAGKDGLVPPPTPGYELTSTVIVRTREAGAPPVAPALGGAAPAVVAHGSLPRYWFVTAGSVQEAAQLAAALRGDAAVAEAYLEVRRPQPLRSLPDDPNVPLQWHLSNDVVPAADLNLAPAWKSGFTGSGVTIGVIEDGWAIAHPDLAANYHAAASQPGTLTTSHGTSVAGCAAAVAGNDLGGVGVAYSARVSRLYRGTSSANAEAFLFRNDLNTVKTNSWGPLDNGAVSVMSSFEREALAYSVQSGRGGLGTVHLWAAGNGGTGDRVDYDPYASSRYTIAVGAIDDDDNRASYNESGSSMMVVAPSSGAVGVNRGIATTSGTSGYTTNFGGTSAAAPQAAGVVALLLDARSDLTWRDVQHLLIASARRCDPENPGWITNGAGLAVSYDYGFGAIDAGAAVSRAIAWSPVRPETSVTTALDIVGLAIPDQSAAGLERTIAVADNLRLEAVEVEVTALHPFIGDLRIELVGPSGTPSLLTVPRFDAGDDYNGYTFTTVRHWGERSAGEWTLRISDEAARDVGTWTSWRLHLHGTTICAADWNDDAQVNSLDISAFLTAWLGSVQVGTLEGDFDGSGAVNSNDISAFLTAWLQGVAGNC